MEWVKEMKKKSVSFTICESMKKFHLKKNLCVSQNLTLSSNSKPLIIFF